MGPGKLKVDTLGKTCTWILQRWEYGGVWCESPLISDEFVLDSVPGKLQLEFYPKGDDRAKEGRCSLFLFLSSEKQVALRYQLSLDVRSCGPPQTHVFEPGTSWGYVDAGVAPALGPVRISATVLDAKTAKDLPDLLQSVLFGPNRHTVARELLALLTGVGASASDEKLTAAALSIYTKELEQSQRMVTDGEVNLARTQRELQAAKLEVVQKGQELKAAKQESEDKKAALAQKGQELEVAKQESKRHEAALAARGREVEAAKRESEGQKAALAERGRELQAAKQESERQKEALAERGRELEASRQESERQMAALTRQLDAANQERERQKAALTKGQELEASRQESERQTAALARRVQELEAQKALFEDPAKAIQRAFKSYIEKARDGRAQAERLRTLRRRQQERRLAALQRLWRERQARLRLRRQEVERRRGRACGPTTEYDAIFTLKSLSEFIATKQIEMHRSPMSLLDLAVKSRYRIVAVVGLYDKGKTFLINKLFGTDLPSGKLHTTKGLSFYWVEKRRMLVLDTAGVQGTVSYRKESGAEDVQPVLDAQTTESFVFEMISRIAHHLIFVVNDLTWFEQKYVQMLHQKYVQKQTAKQLIVVHNLRTTGLIKEARELFTQQIIQCYAGETSHIAELFFTAKHREGPHVHHFGICDEVTAAGEKFNDTNYKLILNMLELTDTIGSTVVLPLLLEEQLKDLLPTFLNVELPEATDARPELVVKYVHAEAGEAERSGSHVEAGRFVLSTSPETGRITMKKRGVISPLGEIIAHDVTFQPLVNAYDKVQGNEVTRIIQIECPGVARTGVKFKRLANGVKIFIEKQKAFDDVGVVPVMPIRQHHGRWEQDFVYDPGEGEFKFAGSHFADGVLSVTLKRVEDSEWGLDDCQPAFQGSGAAAATPAQTNAGDPSRPTSPRSAPTLCGRDTSPTSSSGASVLKSWSS